MYAIQEETIIFSFIKGPLNAYILLFCFYILGISVNNRPNFVHFIYCRTAINMIL